MFALHRVRKLEKLSFSFYLISSKPLCLIDGLVLWHENSLERSSQHMTFCFLLQVGVIITLYVWLRKIWSDYLYHQRCTFLLMKPTLKKSTIKCAYWSNLIMGDLLRSFSSSLRARMKHARKAMVICGVSHQSFKPFLITVDDPRGVRTLHMVPEMTCDCELC